MEGGDEDDEDDLLLLALAQLPAPFSRRQLIFDLDFERPKTVDARQLFPDQLVDLALLLVVEFVGEFEHGFQLVVGQVFEKVGDHIDDARHGFFVVF